MKYKIEIIVDLPCSDIRDARHWAEYKTGYTGGLSCDNSLIDCELEAISIDIEKI